MAAPRHDEISIISEPENHPRRLYRPSIPMSVGVLFSVLQLYWGVLLLRMAAKALKPKPARAKAD